MNKQYITAMDALHILELLHLFFLIANIRKYLYSREGVVNL